MGSGLGLRVSWNTVAVLVGKEFENLAGFGVPPCLRLRIEDFTVNCHVKDSLRTCSEGERLDCMLIVPKNVRGRAHGTVEIVSGNAVGDIYDVHGSPLRQLHDNESISKPWDQLLDGSDMSA